jgi:DNA mismatch repair protein MutS2
LSRAVRGLPLAIAELLAVADALAVAVAVADALASADEPARGLADRLRALSPPVELAHRLQRAIDREGDAGGPTLSDAASPTLASLRTRAREARQALVHAAERLLRKPGLADAFGDRYITDRENRVVLPVRASAFSKTGAPGTIAGIIHDASQSGQTLYVEPHALVDDNNALRAALVAVRAEEARVIAELSSLCARASDRIAGCVDALVELDAIAARLALSQAIGGITPEVVAPATDAVLELPGVRHPLMLLRGRQVVPNDLVVALGTALVLSGPNAGGKTVALKSIGLCVLMASVGLRLPTSRRARVPLFRAIVTDVGDDQSIARDLSTFSAHISHVVEACAAAHEDGPGTLVLLDEVAVGTDPDQGAALAEAIVTDLVEHDATLVVTTHYERLKLLATREPTRYTNAAVGFDLATLRSTFRVHVGIPGNSSALAVAQRLGVPDAVLERARSLVSDERLRVDALLADVAQLRERLAEKESELAGEHAALVAARLRLETLEKNEVERASAKLSRAHAAATAELRGLQDEIRVRRRALRKAADDADVLAEAEATAQRGRTEVAARAPARAPAPGEPPATIEVGQRVRVESLGAEGEVVSIKGDRVVVQLPHLRTTASRGDLRVPGRSRGREGATGSGARAPARAAERARSSRDALVLASTASEHFGAEARPVEASVDNVVDLRGERAEDALGQLEDFLARAIASDRDVVIVRHGHGSGALRKAIREHLPHLSHVVRHRSGLPVEGGDAVTVVWVRG